MRALTLAMAVTTVVTICSMLVFAQEKGGLVLPEYTFTLNRDQIAIVVTALRVRPYQEVADLLQTLQNQVTAQNTAAAKKEPVEKKPAEAKKP